MWLFLRSLETLRTTQVSGTPCTVSTYVWLSDVELSGPGTEYQSGTLNGVSSDLKRLGLHTYADAAKTMSNVAKLVGLTNTPSQLHTTSVFSSATANISSTEQHVPVDVFCSGKESQLDTEPGPRGFPEQDELSVGYIGARPAFLASAPWSGTTGTRIATFLVNPSLSNIQSIAAPYLHYMAVHTPASHVSELFRYWSGDFVLNVHVVCSQFHRGKLRFYYDPSPKVADIMSLPPESLLHSSILDISESTQCEIVVPFNSHRPMLKTEAYSSRANLASIAQSLYSIGTTAPTRSYTKDAHMGVLSVTVAQPLVSTGTEPVGVYFTVSFRNLKLAKPNVAGFGATMYNDLASKYVYQVGDGNPEAETSETEVLSSEVVKTNAQMFIGEDVSSVRQLLHRSIYYTSVAPPVNIGGTAVTPSTYQSYKISMPVRPVTRGNVSTTIPLSFSYTKRTGGTFYSYVNETFFNHMIQCYIGFKGSFRWKVVPIAGTIKALSLVDRQIPVLQPKYYATATYGSSSRTQVRTEMHNEFGSGSAVSLGSDGALTVEFPDYTLSRYRRSMYNGAAGAIYALFDERELYNSMELTIEYNTDFLVDMYFSTGPDLQMYGYWRAPHAFFTEGLPPPGDPDDN